MESNREYSRESNRESSRGSNMEPNRVFNNGSNKESITSWMQAQRQTLEHMFSDHECLVRFKCLVTGSLLKSQFRCHEDLQKDFQKRVKIVRSRFKSNFCLDTSLWRSICPPLAPHPFHGHHKTNVSTRSFHVQRDAVKDGLNQTQR